MEGLQLAMNKAGMAWPPLENLDGALPTILKNNDASLIPDAGRASKIISTIVRGRNFAPEVLAKLIPFRTKADESIMRSTMKDVLMVLWKAHRLQEISFIADALSLSDHIMVVNLLWYLYFVGLKTFLDLVKMRMLPADMPEYVRRCKTVSNIVKSRGLVPSNLHLVETGSLTGYQNLPVATFDPVGDAKALALASDDRTPQINTAIQQNIVRRFPLPDSFPEPLTLEEFVRGAVNWSTGGAASGEKLTVNFNGESHLVRMSKAMWKLVLNPEEVLVRLKEYSKQRNTIVIKNELGKVRIAVASDLESYLLQSWVMYLCSHNYTQISTNTLEETSAVQDRRILGVISALYNRYSLPGDLAEFDHQPDTATIKFIVQQFVDLAAKIQPQVLEYQSQIIDTFDNAFLEIKNAPGVSEPVTIPVKHSLMSGLRVTTAVGNLWSDSVADLAGASEADISYGQGDDTMVIDSDPFRLIKIKENYDTMRVRMSAGKFSILQGQCEYLRVWTTFIRSFAYPCRSLPGIVQRKPWTNDPFTRFGSLQQSISQILTTAHRFGKPALASLPLQVFVSGFAQRHQITTHFVSAPTRLGGLGIGPHSFEVALKVINPVIRSVLEPVPISESVTQQIATNYSRSLSLDVTRYVPALIQEQIKQTLTTTYSAQLKVDHPLPKVIERNRALPTRMIKLAEEVFVESSPRILDWLEDLNPTRSEKSNYSLGVLYPSPVHGVDRTHIDRFVTLSSIARANHLRVRDIDPDALQRTGLLPLERQYRLRRSQSLAWAMSEGLFPERVFPAPLSATTKLNLLISQFLTALPPKVFRGPASFEHLLHLAAPHALSLLGRCRWTEALQH